MPTQIYLTGEVSTAFHSFFNSQTTTYLLDTFSELAESDLTIPSSSSYYGHDVDKLRNGAIGRPCLSFAGFFFLGLVS